jgi:WD40 repeat protein
VVFNPKDTNTFASASLDRTVKVWSIGQPTPNFTLDGHEKGVNYVDYFNGGGPNIHRNFALKLHGFVRSTLRIITIIIDIQGYAFC